MHTNRPNPPNYHPACCAAQEGLGALKGFTYFFSSEPDTEVLLDRLQWVLLVSLSGRCVAWPCLSSGADARSAMVERWLLG